MVITAAYDDGSTSIVTNYKISPLVLSKDITEVTITYRELGVGASTTQAVTVKNILKQIVIVTPPDETAYEIGDTIDLTGMEVAAYYSDGSSVIVSDYTYSPTTVTSADENEITVSYTEDGITKTTIQEITVGNTPNLTSIEIITQPTKTVYRAGEYFSTEGMEVQANFDDGTSKIINGYTYSPTGTLGKDDTTITVSYTRKGVTQTATVSITVYYLSSIAITQPPTYTVYYDDQTFNTTGMEVTAYYSDKTSKVITDYTYSPEGDLPYGTTAVVISYTDGGVTCTASQAVTVNVRTYDYTNSTVISSSGTYTLSGIGATHRNIRVICIGGGTGGKGGKNGSSGGSGGGCSCSSNYTLVSASNGDGGSGGGAGTGGSGGKIYQKDFIVSSLTDSLTISIGSGGSGGGVNTAGSAGGNSTFTYNGTTASSGSGSSSSTGYTNTFTGSTYAISGNEGVAGGDGGRGFKVSSQDYYGISYYNWLAGDDVTYNGTTYSGGTIYSTSSQVRYLSTYDNEPSYYAFGGSGSGGAAAGNNGGSGAFSRVTSRTNNIPIKMQLAYGGDGADAVAPSAPTTYGNGGNGGNGGGGGGGASGGALGRRNISSESSTYTVYGKTQTMYAGGGGDGGSGSSGSSGAQGCVIIYYS